VTDRVQIELCNPVQAAQELTSGRAWTWIKAMLLAGHRLHIEIRKSTRTTSQNALMWSALNDMSNQIDWHGQKLSAEDWKCMATAALKKQRVVPGVDGGFVVLGDRTSKMTKAEFSELIDLLHALGSQHRVKWSPASIGREWDLAA